MSNTNRHLQPFFVDPPPHGVGSYDEDELEASDKSSPEAGEEDEYDVNNDETFGNAEAATGHEAEPDLEEFANRTACFLFDDGPAALGKLPNPDEIPMPVFDRPTPARDKVVEQSVPADVIASIWGRQTINGAQPIPVPSSGGRNDFLLQEAPKRADPRHELGGGNALDEIERRLGSLGREISTNQWASDLNMCPEEEELERKMLMEAAAATTLHRQQSPMMPLPAGVIRPTPVIPNTSLQSPPFNLAQSLSPHMPPPGFPQITGAPRPMLPPHFVASLMSPTPMSHQSHPSIPPPMQFRTPPPSHVPPPPLHGMQWIRSPGPMPPQQLQHPHYPQANRSVNLAHGPPPRWPGNFAPERGGMGLPPPFPPPNVLAYHYNSQFPPLPSQQQQTSGTVPEVSLVSIRPMSPCYMAQRRVPQQQRPNSDVYVFRRKPNNLPSSRTISDYAFDPYAGFLSKKEREWLIKIHLIQCAGTGDPLEDDFYYTAWKQRNVLKRREDGTRKEKGRYYSFEDTYPSDRYIPPSFSGSLGRLSHCSATLPRQVIDVASHDDAVEEDDGGGSGAKSAASQQKKLKTMLVRIENAALILIECRDAMRKLASLGRNVDEGEDGGVSRTELVEFLQRHSDTLFNYACNENLLPTIMLIQKGRALLFETMTAGVLDEGRLVRIISLLYACMPKYAKRIPDESIPTTIRGLARVLASVGDERLELANNCALDVVLLESSKFAQLSLLALLIALANCHCSPHQLSGSSALLQWLKAGASAKFNLNAVKLEDLPFLTEHLRSLLHWLFVATGDRNGSAEGVESNAQRLLASLEKVLADGSEL